jgi:hypothetical protein
LIAIIILTSAMPVDVLKLTHPVVPAAPMKVTLERFEIALPICTRPEV